MSEQQYTSVVQGMRLPVRPLLEQCSSPALFSQPSCSVCASLLHVTGVLLMGMFKPVRGCQVGLRTCQVLLQSRNSAA